MVVTWMPAPARAGRKPSHPHAAPRAAPPRVAVAGHDSAHLAWWARSGPGPQLEAGSPARRAEPSPTGNIRLDSEAPSLNAQATATHRWVFL